MDETFRQAHHGSVAAIIQILNEQLAEVGVRTRAVWGEGVLQILCEAATVEQLEQTVLVLQIQDILETIAPQKIRRVKINSRIAREEQLLWLEEINRDPDDLLWCQEILLKKPNVITRLKRYFQEQSSTQEHKQKLLKASARKQPHEIVVFGQTFFLLKTLRLLAMIILVFAGGRSLIYSSPKNSEVSPISNTTPDVFAEAVVLATEASQEGQKAKTPAQWLALAAKWEQAAELMAQISSEDPRYPTAQRKVSEYRQNSEIAQKQAQNRRFP